MRIGAKDEPNYEFCINIQGQTNLNNAAYLIARAKGYLGADTFSMHVSSGYDVPIVALFSSSPSVNSGPYFGDKSRQICLDSPKNGGKPSYAFTENPKTINNILPETIAENFVKLMGYSYKEEYKTVHFGAEYLKRKLMMFVPTGPCQAPQGLVPEIRMDYHFNEEVLAQELSRRECFVVTNKPIDLNILKRFRKNIKAIVYVLEKKNNPQFPKDTRKLGIDTFLASFMAAEEVQRLKIDYYEIGVIRTTEKPSQDKIKELKLLPNLYYHSQKILNSSGKLYSGRGAFLVGKEKIGNDFEPVIDTDEFWENLNDYYIVQKCC